MPHRTQFVAQVLLLAGMAGLAVAQDAPQLVVSASEARLEIPLPYQQSWQWNLESTRDDELEYQWDAQVDVADTTYAVGFYLFKYPGTLPAEGQLSALIASGQTSIWRGVAGSPSDLEASLQADLREDRILVIRILNDEMLRRLFAARPDSALITKRMPGVDVIEHSIPIRYDRS